jgi:catechol 2,3-dioxygenase-like lactoylglutathione lyase family enzyme
MFRLRRRWFGQIVLVSAVTAALGNLARKTVAQISPTSFISNDALRISNPSRKETMTQQQKKGIESLQLVNVAVSVMNLEQAINWYSDKLGFTLKYRTPAVEGIELALMEKNGLYVDLIHHPQPVNLEPERKEPPFHLQVTGLRNLVFFVDDSAAADAELKAKGVELMWESNFLPHLGTKVTAFRDMDGNLVAYWEKNDQILNYLQSGRTEA